MFLAKMDEDELNFPTDRYHELNKDAMLEKLVLICSNYFWVATELRFLSESKEHNVSDKFITRPHSDMWHAQGAFMGATFLPYDCPLVDHLTSSYEKYHIKTRKEEPKINIKLSEKWKFNLKDASLRSKLMFKSPEDSKAESRNESTIAKSKSIKLLNLYVEKSTELLPKKLQL